jgi:sulfite reductase alpha subunit-like flavoprotein
MKGVYKYPAEAGTPVLMVAVGGGISVMFSLIQYRMATKDKLGPAYLFFAARYRGAYPLLLRKLDKFLETGVIQGLFTAFSGDGPKKLHMQDLLKQSSSQLWELWQDSRTQLFYCGPQRGLPDDIREILVQITINEGFLAMEEAMAVSGRHVMNFETYQSVST